MKRAAKHGRDENKRDEGWRGSHGWLRLKQGGTPSVLRTSSIPRTAGAEYLLRGRTCWSGHNSSP